MMPIRSFLRGLPGRLVAVALLAAALAACAPRDRHVPDFARASFEPFSRGAAVEIALREWRAFGGIVLPADATAALLRRDTARRSRKASVERSSVAELT